ncbi:TPA: hypothetical protein HA251_03955 [Candidatus Woesearchaeota archaeon]|nr:hypothetical protein [Candidatus Woesearchaeota archaeon]
MAQGWITKQVSDGKRDSQIINELLRTGWTEAEAKQAITEARKTQPIAYRLPTAYTIAFASALAGIFALALYVTADNRRVDNYMSAFEYALDVSIESAVVTISLFVLAWAAYEIAIKHHHPKEHRAFFAIVAGIMGTGAAAWFLFLMILLLRWTQAILFTAVALIILAIAFGILVAVLEATYMTLRSHYDDRPRSSTTRMLAISGICAIVVLVLLLAVSALTQHHIDKTVYDKTVEMRLRIDIETKALRYQAESIPNAYLREAIMQGFDYGELKPSPRIVAHDVVTDISLERSLDAIYGMAFEMADVVAAMTLTKQYAAFQDVTRDDPGFDPQYDMATYKFLLTPAATRETTSMSLPETSMLGIQWKVLEHGKHIQQNLDAYNARTQAYTDFFPADPDMNDPDQAELVAFRIWLHEQETDTRAE